MRYYPVNLDIRHRPCLVVGGGRVATRKVTTLLDCGAEVTVVSPRVTDQLKQLIDEQKVRFFQRSYAAKDLRNVFLVIGATDDATLNQRIHRDAETQGRLCNIADQPHLCNFILPAVISQGDLTVTISTAGKSPAFAKYLRRRLQDQFGREYADFLTLMGAVRAKLLQTEHAPEAHKPLFEQLIGRGLLDKIREQDRSAIDEILVSVLGPEYTYDQLMKSQ